MALRDLRPSSRRAVGVVAASGVAVVAVVGAIAMPLGATAQVDLPDRTVEELIAFAQASSVDAMSGTLEQASELGLPDLEGLMGDTDDAPDAAASGARLEDVFALLTGSHTANVFLDGERGRVQVLDRLGERNVYVDGEAGEAWFVDSETQTATRFAMTGDREAFAAEVEARYDQKRAEAEARAQETGQALPTPDRLLDEVLDRLDETTRASVGSDGLVAGREAYELVLEPRSEGSLVGEMRFAIDGETGIALAASVTARGASEPAFRVGLTEVSFEAPDASLLAFAPAEGIAVVEKEIPYPTPQQLDRWAQRHADASVPADARPVVHGEGWTTVAEFPPGEAGPLGETMPGTDAAQGAALLQQLTRAVDGGRVLETALLTVLFTDDGRVLAGAVTAEHLLAVASGD